MSFKWKEKNNVDVWNLALLGICMVFYLFFPFYDKPVWCVDSPSYTFMSITREPVYPVFLWIFRTIFGEEWYLMPVVIAQSILAAYATWKLGITIRRVKDNSKLLAVLSVCFQFFVTILCRFAALRGSAYTNSILSEGLAFSLYLLFIIQLYLYILERKRKNLIGTSLFALLLINLRSQMLITLVIMLGVYILYFLIKHQNPKKMFGLFLLILAIFVSSKLVERCYNVVVRGMFIEHAGEAMGIRCTLLYTAREEDADLFEDEVVRMLFEDTLKGLKEEELHIMYAPKGWMGLAQHYADSYDAIGHDVLDSVLKEYIEEQFEYSEIDTILQYDIYCDTISSVLLKQKKGDLIRVYLANTAKGFMNSVSRVHRYLNVFTVAAYLLYIILYIDRIRRTKKWKENDETLVLAEIVFIGIVVNSLAVGIMIFTQPRYMIYNMGLFYTGMSLLLYDRLHN